MVFGEIPLWLVDLPLPNEPPQKQGFNKAWQKGKPMVNEPLNKAGYFSGRGTLAGG